MYIDAAVYRIHTGVINCTVSASETLLNALYKWSTYLFACLAFIVLNDAKGMSCVTVDVAFSVEIFDV